MMNIILRIAIPAPLYRYFDYLAPENIVPEQLQMGMRVQVPFGKRKLVGFLVEISTSSAIANAQLKQAISLIDETPLLPATLLTLIRWASDYYHYPLGEVFAAALPNLLMKLEKKRRLVLGVSETQQLPPEQLTAVDCYVAQSSLNLNSHQQQAVDAITTALQHFQTFLLNGVTGSGKTEVYLQAIAKVLQCGQQVLVLVPEIGLTPQTIARFQARFTVPVVAFHSGLTDRQRLHNWMLAKSGNAKIIIGTRSAIFTPCQNLGMIVVDEEHDLSFKQQEGFRYCARDLATVRGRLENIPVILGSATPALETLHNAEQKRFQLLKLPQRVGNAVQPVFRVMDLRNQKCESGLSPALLTAMQQHLAQNGQILLFLNRRGFAPVLLCQSCGWMASCLRCDAKMTLHKTPAYLQCHHCASTRVVDKQCPDCHSEMLFPLGLGTQRLEQVLEKHFPGVSLVRIDRDSTRRKGVLDDMLQNIHEGEHRILIGTQMLAKGHHFPDVTLVAILDADSGLFSADFRANERMGQLLMQVAGRAGRAEKSGEVIVQTYHPEHPLLLHLIREGYSSFAELALQERRLAQLPPYQYLVLIRAEAFDKSLVMRFLNEIKKIAQKISGVAVEIFGPVDSIMPRRAGRSRAQLLLQAAQRNYLHNLLNKLIPKISETPIARRVRWSVDVDPREMS